jgi:DNA helicase HerA-like ATPase
VLKITEIAQPGVGNKCWKNGSKQFWPHQAACKHLFLVFVVRARHSQELRENRMVSVIGHVVEVSGAQLIAALDIEGEAAKVEGAGIGALVRITTDNGRVYGAVSSMRFEPGKMARRVLVIDLLGEASPDVGGVLRFGRGVSVYPSLSAPVEAATGEDEDMVYGLPEATHARVGSLHQDSSRPAFIFTDDLLAKHFAIVGTTGSGKSCAVTLILRAILESHSYAHIMLLDPHNEYGAAFGDRAEIVNVDNLQLPCWLLNFEELIAVLVRGGTPEEQEAQASILKEALTLARRRFAGEGPDTAWITVDTPVPFRVGDLLRILDNAMGMLDKADTSIPYLRLKTRLESLTSDRRFAFMFSGMVKDSLVQIIGRLLRIPVDGKPLTIVDLSGVPSEIVDVVVSMICRLTFDFALWAEHGKVPPVLLICEEAHRYVPADQVMGFTATTRAITRISKEGRKYGISLGLVTQRPSELSQSVLTQCGTLFVLRMSNEVDQQFVANALPESARGMLASLSSLRRQEAIVVGEGVAVPMRIRFDNLLPEEQPRSASAHFAKSWQTESGRTNVIEEGVRRWRYQVRKPSQNA